jgi:spore coat protein CotH
VARVVISEVMYHPVLENDVVDNHEFIELHNPGAQAVSLAGWRLAGDAQFTFPATASLPAGGYVVVARRRDKLAALYGLRPDDVLGDYAGELDNGRGRVTLVDAAAVTVDDLTYRDSFPWPVAADALGAGESWLDPALLPLTKHQHKGHSLERHDVARATNDVANWAPSPLDRPTPGKPNTVQGPPPAIVEDLRAGPRRDLAQPITASDPIVVSATLTADRPVAEVTLEWFLDDLARADEAPSALPMQSEGAAFVATLPMQAERSVIRYRIAARRGGGAREVISPRPTDPYRFHTAYVSPAITASAKARVYQIQIAPTSWGKMWTNVQPDAGSARVLNCSIANLAGANPQMPVGCPGQCKKNDNWNARVPAVFISGGKARDVHVRYQGSRVNRLNGKALRLPMGFAGPTGGGPATPPALSWLVAFPRYDEFDGRGTLILNKNTQSCPGFANELGARLALTLGIPGPRLRYARLYVNGLYYNHVLDIDRVDEDFLRKVTPKGPLGELYKNDGMRWDEGPWGWGDGRVLEPYCGFSPLERYAHNLERKSHAWRDHTEMKALHDDLAAARKAGGGTLRGYLEKTYDVKAMLDYIALVNWGGAWDDMFHNYFPVKKPDGKWMWIPWDFDITWICENATACANAQKTFTIGVEGDPSNRNAIWNHFKDAFLKTFRAEYDARLKELARTTFAAANVKALIDEIVATYDGADAAMAASGVSCQPNDVAARMRRFADDRAAVAQMRLGL